MQIFFYKLASKRILCVEKSVHVLVDKTNSLNENDAQDEDFELDLTKKDVLLIHKKGKSPENGLGPGAVPSKDDQGLNQSGGSTNEHSLGKTSPTFQNRLKNSQNRLKNRL